MTEVPRVRVSTGADLTSTLDTGQPAVLQGMFDRESISELDSASAFIDRFGGTVAKMSLNYADTELQRYRALGQPRHAPPRTQREITLRDYFAMIREDPNTRWLLTEVPLSPALIPLLGPPQVLQQIGITKLQPGYRAGDEDAGCLLFLANAGNASDLHTDWDGKHVLHHQIFGRKRWVIFPPTSAQKLAAFEIFGSINLRTLRGSARRAFLEYAGGVECEVGPGETIYVPPFYFHDVEYLEDALGIAFRVCGPGEEIARLLTVCHRGLFLQNLYAWALRAGDAGDALIHRIQAAYEADYSSAFRKFEAIDSLARSLCRELDLLDDVWKVCPHDFMGPLLSLDYVRPNPAWGRVKSTLWALEHRLLVPIKDAARRLAS